MFSGHAIYNKIHRCLWYVSNGAGTVIDIGKFSFTRSLLGKDNTVQYCEYMGVRHSVDTKWDEGYPECLNCTCASYGLECCG